MQLTNLQREKVMEIVARYDAGDKIVQFKAPTGSGKTLMATNVIAHIINNHPEDKFIFVIATVSTSNLPLAFEQKIKEYKSDLIFSDFEVEYIESPSNNKNNKSESVPQIRVVENKVYIFGKATFGKGRIFTEQEVLTDFVQDCKSQGYKIIYIRDEAHIGAKSETSDIGVKNFENLMDEYANFTVKMTATFDKKVFIPRIELKESDLCDPLKNENRWLIKCNLQKLNDDTTSDSELLDIAIREFKSVQMEYKKLSNVIIRPAMLIQVDNEPSDVDEKRLFNDTIDEIKRKLTANGLSWVKYFGDSDKEYSNVDNANFTLNKITRNNDTTDCIIFKIGPATGWDIPRACMLLQLRNVCSSNLNIQTIGRIKRNPYPNLEKNSVTDKYYIFTNAPKDKNTDYAVCGYKVKDIFKKVKLAVIKIIKSGQNKINIKKANELIGQFIQDKQNDILYRLNQCFDNGVYREPDKKLIINNPILLLKRIAVIYRTLNTEQQKIVDLFEPQIQIKFSQFHWEQIKIILLVYFYKNIIDIYKGCIPMKISYKIEEETINPDAYTEVFETNTNNQTNIANSNYLFDITQDGDPVFVQQLDSENEQIVSNNLKQIFETLTEYLGKNPIRVWCKNQTRGNIFGEYLDYTNNDRKSYFDFVIKFENGNYLYLEVKGDDNSDIDNNKTRLLANAYSDYFQNLQTGIFKQKIIICILRVDKNTNTIIPECFYDKNQIKTDLSGVSLSKIIKTLADNV